MHLLRSARRILPTLAFALGLTAASTLTTSCSTSYIPFVGKADEAEADPDRPLTTDERRLQLANDVVISQGGEITKVKYYHLDSHRTIRSADPAVTFEQRHYLHGAITLEQRLARYGHYYTIFWNSDDRSTPVTVVFEYRQKNTGPAALTKTVTVDDIGRRNQTPFKVTGEEYWERGPVTAWRVTLVQGDNTIAADQSFLWD